MKNQPAIKTKSGKFQISIWNNAQPGKTRACIQYSQYKQEQGWSNQQIWCNGEELLDLREALDLLKQEAEQGEQPDASPSSKKTIAFKETITDYLSHEELLDGEEIQRLAQRAENPELEDPVFLEIKECHGST